MPFESEPSVEVTARDRLIRLRDFLAELPDERFDIARVWTKDGEWAEKKQVAANECGTAACIVGWYEILYPHAEGIEALTQEQHSDLCAPEGYNSRSTQYTRARAVIVIDHYLETGRVDWSVAFQ